MKQKRIVILFSGGLDSTYLAWRNLKDGHEVVLKTIKIENNENKTKMEMTAIDKIHAELYKEFSNKVTLDKEFVKVNINTSFTCSLRFSQMPIWIFSSLFLSSDFDEIQIGYVMNDDAVSHIGDLKRMYSSYQPIYSRKLPKLSFPIIKRKKYELLEELPNNYKNLVVFCETPNINEDGTNRECGTCHSCKRYMFEEIFMERFEKNHLKTQENSNNLLVDYDPPGVLQIEENKQISSMEIEIEVNPEDITQVNKMVEI